MTGTNEWLFIKDTEGATTWRQDREVYTDAMEVTIKFDGCEHLSEASDHDDEQYLHVCDFDRWVDMLIDLRAHMRRRFHGQHPEFWKAPTED